MTENKYGLLTFIAFAGVNKFNKPLWRMQCACGKETVAIASRIKTGKTKSCGHLKSAGNNRRHGKRHSRLYTAWCNMKARCDRETMPQYKDYGGRGIVYDPTWAVFENFAADVGEPPTEQHTLDRIDNDGNYEKHNVRWASRETQSRNTRQNIWVEIDGVTKCLHDWCDDYGISAGAIYKRLANGIPIKEALLAPKVARFSKVYTRPKNR